MVGPWESELFVGSPPNSFMNPPAEEEGVVENAQKVDDVLHEWYLSL